MKQNWFYRFERKFGHLRIPGLMKYIVAIEIVGAILGLVNPALYTQYLMLDYGAVMQGQVWRLFTFIFYPGVSSADMGSMLLFALEVYIYYSIGNSLENVWGAFRFTWYYISGFIMSIIAGFIVYIITSGMPWIVGFEYINLSLFLAFAVMFPNVEFLIMFLIPVKAKWLGIFYIVMMGLTVVQYLAIGPLGVAYATAIVVSMLNFVLFYLVAKNPVQRAKVVKRKAEFRKQMGPKVVPLYRHRCAICGRTERDNEELEFRFCSKCDGNFEYCSDHIYTHEHVKKEME